MIKVVMPCRGFKLQLSRSHMEPCFYSEEVLVSAGTELRSGTGFQAEDCFGFFFSKIQKVLSSVDDCTVARQLLICTEVFKIVT